MVIEANVKFMGDMDLVAGEQSGVDSQLREEEVEAWP